MAVMSRRVFLELVAGGGAATTAGLISNHYNKLIPYVVSPQETLPGVWSVYSTTCRECPAGCGMHLRHCDGRVVKAEGIPDHPVNHGGLCARGQSAVQGLYDPDRVKTPLKAERGGEFTPTDWSTALESIGRRLGACKGKVIVLSDLQTGTLAEVMERFAAAIGQGRVLLYEPLGCEALRAANESLFDLPVVPDYRLAECDFVLSLATDFLETWISPVRFARDFANMHTVRDGKIGRFVYAGPRYSMTAANADEFLPIPPASEGLLAMAMVDAIIRNGWAKTDIEKIRPLVAAYEASAVATRCGIPAGRIVSLARQFAQARASVALGGPAGAVGPLAQRSATAAMLLNYVCGRVGQTVDFSRTHVLDKAASGRQVHKALSELSADDVLLIHAANPAYSLPGSAGLIRQAGTVAYLGTMMDETARLADWVLPVDSPLESWGDYEPQTGVMCLLQPTMDRLHDTRGAGDIFLALAETAGKPLDEKLTPGAAESSADEASDLVGFEAMLRWRWKTIHQQVAPSRPFDEFWHDALRAGGVWKTPTPVTVALRNRLGPWNFSAQISVNPPATAEAELWVWSSIMLHDGRAANRGWLQEAPEPMRFASWGSWVDIHPRKAAALDIHDGDVLQLQLGGKTVEAPACVTEDVHPDVVAVALGQGHSALGRNAAHRGVNAFGLLAERADAMFGRVTIRKTGGNSPLAVAAFTQDQHHREILQWVDLAELAEMKNGGQDVILPLPEGYRPDRDLYPPREYKEHRWAMVVDLQRCIGCGACAVACYAENNIAVVGEEKRRRMQDMPWLQVVPYRDPADAGRAGFLPMMCQQCDAAPCEPVCPVFASVHNEEGLNAQVYNRCIGTRYCSNNCPYKVRRFNWNNITWQKPLDVQLNPEVSVRERGVMEKCTFCIQRIREVQHHAKRQGRAVRDGEVLPACAQSCPTRAIVFGDLLDDSALVSRLTRHNPRRYHVLEELNTKPAVTYLRRIRQ